MGAHFCEIDQQLLSGVYKVAFRSPLGGEENQAVGEENQVGKKGRGRE